MSEEKLRDYFDSKLSPQELTKDLINSQKRTSHDVATVYIDSIENDEFEVTKDHLIRLCEDVISENIPMADLNTIGFALMASDYFTWNSDTKEGKIMSEIIFDGDSPEIGVDIVWLRQPE